MPKGVVLLADVIPSFLTKLCAPYFIHKIPYNVRILIFVALSACGMLIIALTPPLLDATSIGMKMFGVILASLSSGGGELSFLGLTHYYGQFALASWGSGTGGAGLIGAGAYAIFTTTLQISPRNSLLAFSFLPVIMLISFFMLLPKGPLLASTNKSAGYEAIESNEYDEDGHDGVLARDEDSDVRLAENETLLSSSLHSASGRSFSSASGNLVKSSHNGFKANLKRAQGLFFPYMLPLLLVYVVSLCRNEPSIEDNIPA